MRNIQDQIAIPPLHSSSLLSPPFQNWELFGDTGRQEAEFGQPTRAPVRLSRHQRHWGDPVLGGVQLSLD